MPDVRGANPDPAVDTARVDSPRAPDLFGALPLAVRREGGDDLRAYLGSADDAFRGVGAALGSARAQLRSGLAVASRALASRSAARHAFDLAAWFGARGIAAPRVWSGVRLRPLESPSEDARVDGDQAFVLEAPGGRGSAVFAWERGEAEPASDVVLPPGLVPIGVEVQAFLCASWPATGHPLIGWRLEGRLLGCRSDAGSGAGHPALVNTGSA